MDGIKGLYTQRMKVFFVRGESIPVNVEFFKRNERVIRLGFHDHNSVVELVDRYGLSG